MVNTVILNILFRKIKFNSKTTLDKKGTVMPKSGGSWSGLWSQMSNLT